MSKNLRNFVQAVYAFDAVVQRSTDDQWGNPTPCTEWNALQLLEHQCAVLNGVQAMAQSGEMAKPTPPADLSSPLAAWEQTRDRLLASLDRSGSLGQQGPFWFNAATIDDVIGIVMWDAVAHTWDLAQATGQPHGIAESLALAAYDVVAPLSDMFVETNRTAARQDPPPGASAVDRYIALTGRTPL